jgi:hypothetical protein
MKYQFSLNDKQEKELHEWKEKIKNLHGEYGNYAFRFVPTAIGTRIYIENNFVKELLDLSHVEDW